MKDKQWESNRPPNWIYGCVDYEAGATEMLKACRENWEVSVPKDHIYLLKEDYCLATGVKIE